MGACRGFLGDSGFGDKGRDLEDAGKVLQRLLGVELGYQVRAVIFYPASHSSFGALGDWSVSCIWLHTIILGLGGC